MNAPPVPAAPAPGFRDRLPYQPALLGTVTLAAAAALSLAHLATREHIAAAEAHDMQMTLAQVLPAGYADNDLLNDVVEIPDGAGKSRRVHRARKAGQLTGAVFGTRARGYGGEIRMLMAVATDGRVLGVRVLKHTETPGLGDKIEAARHPWITTFNGRSLDDPPPEKWAVTKDGGIYDSFAGATITPRAVVRGVREGLEFFRYRRADILGAQP